MYPGYRISSRYSELAARYLLTGLKALRTYPQKSLALLEACNRAVEMATDVAAAHGLQIPPRQVTSCRDAFDVMSSDSPAELKEEASRSVVERLQAEGPYLAVRGNGSAVQRRAETAFAAGALFLAGGAHIPRAVKAANWVTGQMRSTGAW